MADLHRLIGYLVLTALKYSFRIRNSPSLWRETGGRNFEAEFADYRRGSIAFSATESTIVADGGGLDGH